jgi:hypothetical protein
MRAALLLPFAAATAEASATGDNNVPSDYSSYMDKYRASSSGNNSTQEASASQYAGGAADWKKYSEKYRASSAGNSTQEASASQYAGGAADWQKYASKSGSSQFSMDGGKDSSDNTYSGPFQSDESVLKLKGNVSALNAKKKQVEFSMEQVKKHVPEKFQAAPLGQYKKDLSDIRDMLKEAEASAKQKKEAEADAKDEQKSGAQTHESSAASGTQGTALLARGVELTVTDTNVDKLEDKIEAVKKDEDAIKKYAPKEYQKDALKSPESHLAALEAELKAAKKEVKEEAEKKAEEEKEKKEEEKKEEEKKEEEKKEDKNATSSKGHARAAGNHSRSDSADSAGADAGTALMASAGPMGFGWGSASICFCATVSVLSALVTLRRRSVNVDQQPLLG